MEFAEVGTEQFVLLVTGAALFLFVPVIIALIWTIRKKERFQYRNISDCGRSGDRAGSGSGGSAL